MVMVTGIAKLIDVPANHATANTGPANNITIISVRKENWRMLRILRLKLVATQ
jgi:hypothetical protein